MTDIASRIWAELDFHKSRSDWFALSAALRAIMAKCDEISTDIHGKTFWPGRFIADDIRSVIAEQLGISDSPAVAPAGSQPTSVTAGVPTLTDPLIIAIGQELAGRVWDPPLPRLPVGQWTEIVELIARCVREEDTDRRWVKAERRADWAADANDRGECA